MPVLFDVMCLAAVVLAAGLVAALVLGVDRL
jgi:hypothetical protein